MMYEAPPWTAVVVAALLLLGILGLRWSRRNGHARDEPTATAHCPTARRYMGTGRYATVIRRSWRRHRIWI